VAQYGGTAEWDAAAQWRDLMLAGDYDGLAALAAGNAGYRTPHTPQALAVLPAAAGQRPPLGVYL
jgi:hypothetical protein